MSRLLKLIASVFVLVAGGGVAIAAASAPAHTRSHMIVCPLEPSDTITPPCCGPPIVTTASSPTFACCGTPQPINCPVGLTLSSSADPSVAGQKITLMGQSPSNVAGQTVDLFQELPGAKTFTKVAHTTIGSAGEFRFVRKGVETNRKWYVSVGSEHSLQIAQQVKAVVTLGGSGGRVTPNHAGERVLIERRNGSRWVVMARPRLSRGSTYAARVPGAPLRAVFPGDRRNIRSVGLPSGPVGPY